jgi:hypothetical protein
MKIDEDKLLKELALMMMIITNGDKTTTKRVTSCTAIQGTKVSKCVLLIFSFRRMK